MTKFLKLFFASLVVLAFFGFLAFGLYQKNQQQAIAQNLLGETRVICEEPIPVGIAIDEGLRFLNIIYQALQGSTIASSRDQVNNLIATVNANGNGQVCDFDKKCASNVGEAGPRVTFETRVLPLLPGSLEYSYNVPSCYLGEGVGEPCPSLGDYLTQSNTNPITLEGFKDALNSEAENIHLLFEGENEDIPAGLEKPGEVVGVSKTNKADLVFRLVNSVEKDWLTPTPSGNSCVSSELDKERIKQGLMGEKYPLSCLSALAQGIYSPKPWSETCQKECADNKLSDECRACLAECEGDSVFATLNCKMYSTGNKPAVIQECLECKNPETGVCDSYECNSGNWGADCVWGKQFAVSVESSCYQKVKESGKNDKCSTIAGQSKKCCGNECINGVNSECYKCLCDGLTQEQCLDWVCGGSKSNWVCCHEEPIQNPQYYVVNKIFSVGGEVESYTSPTGEKVYRIAVGKGLTFGEAYGLALDITTSYLPGIDPAFLLGNMYKESRFIAEAGKCDATDIATKIRPADKAALEKITAELGLDYYAVPLSCAEKIGSGGAMGPAQFMPTTWWNIGNDTGYKFDVQAKTKETANPWDFRDAFLASALFLYDKGARIGDPNSEMAAAAAYYSGSKTKTNNYSVWAAMCYKEQFQKLIIERCLDPMGPRSAICQDAERKVNKACSKTQYNINRAIELITFWR